MVVLDLASLPPSDLSDSIFSWKNISNSIISSANPKDPFFLKAFKQNEKKFTNMAEKNLTQNDRDDSDIYYELEKRRLQADLRTKFYDIGKKSKERKTYFRNISRMVTKVFKIDKNQITNKILFSKKLSEPFLHHLDFTKTRFATESALDHRRLSDCLAISGGKIQKDTIFLSNLKTLPKIFKKCQENEATDEEVRSGRQRNATLDPANKKLIGAVLFGSDEKLRKQKRIQSINKAYKKVAVITKFKLFYQYDVKKNIIHTPLREEKDSPLINLNSDLAPPKITSLPSINNINLPQSYLFKKKFSHNNHSIAQHIFHSRKTSLASIDQAKSNKTSFNIYVPNQLNVSSSQKNVSTKNKSLNASINLSKKIYGNPNCKKDSLKKIITNQGKWLNHKSK